ncbi:Rsn1p Ecym_2697 [Eremothecium cymbalariae DBVPG|uniref:Uncharacterized protein n=1 Tax=Eremothecium cymbalariae (strain CBS 270.75 / DBVPG 7215 / KCTC 17166 / NRRL Y-17582) TaxID=931890 RepID=G8JPD8_ERECY|nr:Hypothetical protein Ecym_2697 [Eremothecium cymbalariae DBVPG\
MATSDSTQVTNKDVLWSIVTYGSVFGVFIICFLLLRLKLKRIYQPKSSFQLINDEKKPEQLPNGIFQWLPELLRKSDNFIIQQAGLDGYFFVRYLYLISMYMFISSLWILPLLVPLNVSGSTGDLGFDKLTFSNIRSKKRYYAHVFASWLFFWGFLFLVYRELTYFTSVRQVVLSSPRYAKKLSSRTVLFQCVPSQYLSEVEFSKLFVGVKRIWITRAADDLASKVAERDDLAMKLEAAETAYLKKAVKRANQIKAKSGVAISGDISEYVPNKHRPKHRLTFLIGKKVDTIDYIKGELVKLNKEVVQLQADHMNAEPFNSVFVEFESQYYAQMAQRSIPHHAAFSMIPSYCGIEPKDVIWFNMKITWWKRIINRFIASSAVIGLIILWAFPVAFVGLISSVTYLTEKVPQLRFIEKLPPLVLGMITSLLPTIGLTVLMMILPMFIRKMGIFSGSPSVQHVEYFTQQAFFGFQVIQVFLVITLSKSATTLIPQLIGKPTGVMNLLAENLPKSSNFYISYVLLHCFSFSSGVLLQLVPMILYYVLGALFDNTARKKWSRFVTLSSADWGVIFPVYTNLLVIAMAYSIISPIIIPFCAIGFFLLYVAYLYTLTYVFQETPDSRGIHYPRALFQSFTGIYIGQIALLGLFVVGKGWGPIILQGICIGFTAVVHFHLSLAFDTLMTVVPVDTMKPLDGKSETPSFKSPKTDSPSEEIKELPQFPVRKYQPRNSLSIDQKTSSLLSDNTYEIQNPTQINNENTLFTVPLLADGDVAPIPPAPFWKRYFLPDIYCSYKAVKTRLPEIYNLPDPSELLDDEEFKYAYCYPAVSSKCPCIWLPRDPFGFSTALIADLEGVIDASDKGAMFDSNDNIIWTSRPPDFSKKADEFESFKVNFSD